ncbi:MAG: SPOR domain-containing protein [Nitrococcus sp.]|nr:SPOR domain-containing protein [Nitrococcus sp.]
MEQRAKQRLVGAVILVALGVIFIPMLLKGPVDRDRPGIPVEIPPRPRVAPVPHIPKADVLEEPAPGHQLAERPPPVSAARPNSASGALESSPVPADEPRRPASTSQSSARPESAAAVGERAGVENESKASAGAAATLAWAVQVGSFQNRDNAQALRQKLAEGGFNTYIEQAPYEHKTLFRVRVGPVAGRGEAERLATRLHEEHGIKGLVVEK